MSDFRVSGAVRVAPLVEGSQRLAWLLWVMLIGACAEEHGSSTSAGPTRAAVVTPKPLTDENPDPDVVEVQLVAAEGEQAYLPSGRATVWGYRDGALASSKVSVPGPLLEAQQGQKVIVHFTNELPESTTVHWHGLRVPNGSDGTPSVQVEVEPGQSYTYSFEALDAGTFWFHPHMHSDVQIERGLYAPLVVHGGPDIEVDADRVFVLDDIKLKANGSLATDTTQLDVMLGRQGNVLLVNGVRNGRIVARSGARERWRFVNVANGRYFNLRLRDHKLKVISWDAGPRAVPYETDSLLIVPGERYEVLVELDDAAGSELSLETVHYDRGHDIPDPGPQTLLSVGIESKAPPPASLPESWGLEPELDVPDAASEHLLELTEQMPEGERYATFHINGKAYPEIEPIKARSGAVEIFKIYNHSEMDHPFHLHGMFFRVLDVDGEEPEHVGWKDTVNVPREHTLRFAVRYAEPGTWMYHCHILEHAERGMMGELELSDVTDEAK